jgi:hypothetical protein
VIETFQGNYFVETSKVYERPVDVSVQMRLVSGSNECGVVAVFPKTRARHSGYTAGVGWWSNYFGAGVDGRIARYGNNGGNNLKQWHLVRINVADNGKVYFYLNGQLRRTITDNRYRRGKIRLGNGCRMYQYRDLTIKNNLPAVHWIAALSKGSYGKKDIGEANFNRAFWASKHHIIKRVCASCRQDYKVMYYRRYTAVKDFAIYDYLKNNWKSSANRLNKDFGIFSSYQDALVKQNPWRFCNYDDKGIGFPRDCGKKKPGRGQWNSWTRGGKSVIFYIEGQEEPSGGRVQGLKNGWLPYGKGYSVPQTAKYGKLCVLSGTIKRRGNKNPLTTLPEDCRPTKRLIFNLYNNGGKQNRGCTNGCTLRVDVLTNGQIHIISAKGQYRWISLSGISFTTGGQKNVRVLNSWKGYGGSYRSPTYTRLGKLCEVEGLLRGSKWGRPMVQLPRACRPRQRLIFNVNNHARTARVDVKPNGHITWIGGGRNHGWISLSGIVFPTTTRTTNLKLLNSWRSYGGEYGKVNVAETGTLCVVSGLI